MTPKITIDLEEYNRLKKTIQNYENRMTRITTTRKLGTSYNIPTTTEYLTSDTACKELITTLRNEQTRYESLELKHKVLEEQIKFLESNRSKFWKVFKPSTTQSQETTK